MWKYPYKTNPYKHQRDALQESANKTQWAYFMEMGTGKTKVTIDNFSYLYLLNKINTVGEKAFSVEHNTLKEVLDSGVLNKTYFDNLQNNADAFCKLTCGKCDNNKYKVV